MFFDLKCYARTRERRNRMTNLRESVQFERAVEISEKRMHSIQQRLISLAQANSSSAAESDSGLSVDVGGEPSGLPTPLSEVALSLRAQQVNESDESGLETPSPSHCSEQEVPISTTASQPSSSWVCPIHLAALQESGMTAYSSADNHGIQNLEDRGQNACCDFYKSVSVFFVLNNFEYSLICMN